LGLSQPPSIRAAASDFHSGTTLFPQYFCRCGILFGADGDEQMDTGDVPLANFGKFRALGGATIFRIG